MMSTTALYLTLSLAFLAIAAHARPLSSDDTSISTATKTIDEFGFCISKWRETSTDRLERAVTKPPPSPKSAPPEKHITSNLHNDEPATPESQLKAPNSDNGKIKRRSPPPPPASSKSPTHSENIASPCVAANPCSSSSFIAMVTDELARPKHLPPPRPKVASPTYIMM